jgi:cytochrome c biogenesis protein CcdA
MKPAHLLVLLGFLIAADARAQDADSRAELTFHVSIVPGDPFHPMNEVGAKPEANKLRRGQVAKLVIEGKLKPGFHTYALTTLTGRQDPLKLWKYSWTQTPGVAPIWPIEETQPEFVEEEKIPVAQHLKDFTWTHDVLVLPDAPPGKITVPISLRGQVCDDSRCVLVREKFEVAVEISPEEPLPVSAPVTARLKEPLPEPSLVLMDGDPKPRADVKFGNVVLLKPETPVVLLPSGTANPPQVAPRVAETPGGVVPPTAPGGAGAGPAGHQSGTIFAPVSGTAEDYRAEMDKLATQIQTGGAVAAGGGTADLWAFILAGIFWGAVSLVTPCVFPMIPITVSFFLKQSEKEHHRPITMAVVYSATIIIVLTLAAAFLLSVFRWLSVNPIMNYALGALFIFFALSLFGMYDIELPSGLARFTSSREGQGGYVGTVFMALTFTIISFACVAPFLGGFGGTAAGIARPWWHNILGGLAFSTTFAAPFFFLALFPTLLRSMPKSGSWLNSVKVVMGFLELAAAFKFMRSAELVLTGSQPWLFTFDFCMGIYVALCFLCGLYLIGAYRLPHDTPEEHVSVPRMLFAGLFLSLGLYFLPALFKGDNGQAQRPRGTIYAWVDSFLLPEVSGEQHIPNTANLSAAVAQGREEYRKTGRPRRLFLDFTGVS